MSTLKHFSSLLLILNNRRITIIEVIEIADDVGRPFDKCPAIFVNVLGMKHKAAKIVPNLLNFEQKQRRMDLAQKMLRPFKDDSDLL